MEPIPNTKKRGRPKGAVTGSVFGSIDSRFRSGITDSEEKKKRNRDAAKRSRARKKAKEVRFSDINSLYICVSNFFLRTKKRVSWNKSMTSALCLSLKMNNFGLTSRLLRPRSLPYSKLEVYRTLFFYYSITA